MRGAVMHGPGDVRVEERDEPRVVEPTDAIIRVSAVFDLELPLEDIAAGYEAMNERPAVKALVRP
jgi:threonine dehydrogenase-like Zn-dependent dehydrogenase